AARCTVWAIDRDPDAIAAGQALAAEFAGRLELVEGNFADMETLLAARGVREIDGVALDLGVSSMQLDAAARGFSFRSEGPLDMRMSRTGRSAADLVNDLEEGALADLIYQYGEERQSRRIARAIVAARKESPLTTTKALADVVHGVLGAPRPGKIDPATRTFQALRIAVNDELGALERGLAAAERLLRPGGRLAVVSFHSLEDRVVKQRLRAKSARQTSRLLPGEEAAPAPVFELLSRKAIRPSAEEAEANPRARSARLRAAIKLPAREAA
ncbi:MAG: 16S rRNA (cytosine(1402)-N(4))-methyltransferase RsmH, partial [Chromatiales bacterium]